MGLRSVLGPLATSVLQAFGSKPEIKNISGFRSGHKVSIKRDGKGIEHGSRQLFHVMHGFVMEMGENKGHIENMSVYYTFLLISSNHSIPYTLHNDSYCVVLKQDFTDPPQRKGPSAQDHSSAQAKLCLTTRRTGSPNGPMPTPLSLEETAYIYIIKPFPLAGVEL